MLGQKHRSLPPRLSPPAAKRFDGLLKCVAIHEGAAFTIEGEKGLFIVDERCVLAVVSKE